VSECLRYSFVLMEYASFLIILLIASGSWLLARQNFRLRPSRCHVLGSIVSGFARLWNVRFFGHEQVFESSFLSVRLRVHF
jgi:hypothetical protein